ncbi:MAG: hypothetical protein V1706_08215 [Pseudomonadota bacterium]
MGFRGVAGKAYRYAKREVDQEYKQQLKYMKRQEANSALEEYENYIEQLLTIHKNCSKRIDWHSKANISAPQQPLRRQELEEKARNALAQYRPGFFDRLFNLEKEKRTKLIAEIEKAKENDDVCHKKNIEKWEEQLSVWKENYSLTKRVLKCDSDAFAEVLKKYNPFSDIGILGTEISFRINDDGIIDTTINIAGEEVIPKEHIGVLKSGKLSVKQMPNGKYFELYQNYVCGCVLRIAKELFSLLPIDITIITAIDKILNRSTGHNDYRTILSVAIERDKLYSLNMDLIKPSDSMENFFHRMLFLKTKGFQEIKRITTAEL